MEEHRSDFVVIAAGYDGKMGAFLASNPGLASRFTLDIHFDDYTPSQLATIFSQLVQKFQIELSAGARSKLDVVLQQMSISFNIIKRNRVDGFR